MKDKIFLMSLVIVLSCFCNMAGQEKVNKEKKLEIAEQPGLRCTKEEVGPEVPLTEQEKNKFIKKITVNGFTTEDVQSALKEAKDKEILVVYFPEGKYEIKEIYIPEGIILLGAGSKTHISIVSGVLFYANGDNVRITRMKLEGADPTPATTNKSVCFKVNGYKNIRIDHCEVTSFEWGLSFWQGAIGQVDHCIIHNNCTDGMGYGVMVMGGSQVLVCDNIMYSNRHSLASNNANTHYTFRHNHVIHDKGTAQGNNVSQCDAHKGLDKGGSFVIEYNIFENLKQGIGCWAGQGIVRNNFFNNVTYAIWITADQNTQPAEIKNNKFENVTEEYRTKNSGVSGESELPRPLEIPYMKEMDEKGNIGITTQK